MVYIELRRVMDYKNSWSSYLMQRKLLTHRIIVQTEDPKICDCIARYGKAISFFLLYPFKNTECSLCDMDTEMIVHLYKFCLSNMFDQKNTELTEGTERIEGVDLVVSFEFYSE